MSASDLLTRAQALGAHLWVEEGEALRWRCPGGLPADLKESLVAHKKGLLEVLRTRKPACPATWHRGPGSPSRLCTKATARAPRGEVRVKTREIVYR